MFQNIADTGFQEELEEEKNSNIKYRLKQIFKIQNIIIYILTVLMSTLSVKNEIMPFGLAMVAACVGESIPIAGVFIMAIIGTVIKGGVSAVVSFLSTIVIYFIFVLIFKSKVAIEDRNENVKSGGKLFTASIIVSLIKCIKGGFLFYDFFMGIVAAAIIYVFYKIFVNGLVFIKNIKIKSAFTTEELIGSVIIVAIASIVFNKLNIFSLNISNIIIIFMIMVLGWKYGMMIGAVTGIAVGVSISLIDGTSFVQISMFAISGILSGLLNRFGKIGVIIGFILGNAMLTYWVRGASPVILYFREIFIASIGLLLVPQNFKIDLEDLIGSKTKLISNHGDNRLKPADEDVSKKLRTISDMFNQIINTPSKEEMIENENFIQDFLDNLEDVKNNIFYEEISNEENGIARDICKVLRENDIIVDKEVVEVLKNHNNYVVMQDESIKNDLQEIVKIANRTLKIAQINKAKEEERKRNLQSMNKSLENVGKVIENCAQEIVQKKENEFNQKEQQIELLLKSKNIDIEECKIKLLSNGKHIVEVKLDYNNEFLRRKEITNNISEIISKGIGSKIAFQRDRINEEEKEYYQVYASEDKYVLQVGSAKITKDGSKVSGDCSLQIKLADGKYLLAIADGMGSGAKARESSKVTLRLIKQMLSAGFDKEESLQMINSRMFMLNKESYSTLDVIILDLYSGKAELIKNAACSTYIKNNKEVAKIELSNLPVGIIDTIELQSETVSVNNNDIYIMCSDGVLETKDDTKENWIEEFLKNVSTNNVQKIADLILAEAIDNNFGIAPDDMTVIVSKIVRRK